MPLVLFLILVVLIAQIGFWDTIAAVIGGIAAILLLFLLVMALVALVGVLAFRRLRG